MMMTEEKVIEMLSKSENEVYGYIKREAQAHGGSIKESMKDIGNHLGLSEATVHRAVRKLRKQGIIGIVPSMEKAESNEIRYHGVPDPDKQVSNIIHMISELNSAKNQFETTLAVKQQEIDKLQRDKELLYQEVDKLTMELKLLRAERTGIDMTKIISSQPLDDGTTAYIIKN